VVAGDVDDTGILAALSQQLLDQDVVLVVPVPPGPQLPPVEKVADDVQIPALAVAEEFQQQVDLRVPGPEMDVGNPYRAVLQEAVPV
jgi:hypothetical protein